MDQDIKDVIGILMRMLDGAEISHEELNCIAFEADGELETALNEAYVKMHEFTNDRDLRRRDPRTDQDMRSELKGCLDHIVQAAS